jgi:hypothetical protein
MISETTASLFDLAIIGETSSRDFYEGLSKKFSHDKNISAFWQNMSADEAVQIETLEGLRRYMSPDKLSSPADKDIFQIALENSKIQTGDVLNMVKNLNDAYVIAMLWENSEINRVFEFLITQYMPAGADGRFSQIQLMTHKKKLQTFEYAFGEAEMRKSISTEDEQQMTYE